MPECLHMCKKCSTFADDFVVCVLPRSVTALNREGCANQPLSRSRESHSTAFLHSNDHCYICNGKVGNKGDKPEDLPRKVNYRCEPPGGKQPSWIGAPDK